MAAVRHKIKLREVNRHLVCRLCRGYYVDATTIAECLHSFCRSCIIKYLETNSFCPICEVQIHKTKPYLNLRLDKALQDVVYKLVPGLYHNEMARRRLYYEGKPYLNAHTTPEQRGVEERLIFSPEDSISLSLEFMDCPEQEAESVSSRSSDSGEDFPLQLGLMKVRRGDSSARKESTDSNEPSLYPKRYLLCPAVVSIRLLKKFLTIKFELSSNMNVEIMHKRVPLADHYTLMDVAYIFTWKRMAPMRLFYQIYKVKSDKIPQTIVPEPRCLPAKPDPVTVMPEPRVSAKNIPQVSKLQKGSENSNKENTGNFKLGLSSSLKTIDVKVKDSDESIGKVVNDSSGGGGGGGGGGSGSSGSSGSGGGIKKDLDVKVVSSKNVQKCETGNKTEPNLKPSSMPLKHAPGPLVKAEGQKTTYDNSSKTSKGGITKPPLGPSNEIMTTKLSDLPNKNKGNNLTTLQSPQPTNVDQGRVPVVSPETNINKKTALPRPPDNLKTHTKSPEAKPDQPPMKAMSQQPNAKTTPVAKHPLPVGLVKKSETKIDRPVARSGEKLLLNPISGKLEPASPEKETLAKKSLSTKTDDKPMSKSSVQQLKTFRKEKHVGKTNSLTITTAPSKEKSVAKEEANVSIEIKTEGKGSEYDFESSSPPNRIMSLQEYTQSELYKSKYGKINGNSMNLQDFRKQVLNGNSTVAESPEDTKKERNKMVPSLYRINPDKKISPKVTKKEDSLRVININTPDPKAGNSPPKPIKIENKKGEYSIKSEGGKTPKRDADTEADAELLRLLLKRRDAAKSKAENAEGKRSRTPIASPKPLKPPTPIDLSKVDPAAQMPRIPLESLVEMAKKPLDQKKDQNMLEMLVSIAQKQSIEPLLKVPQYPQGSKSGSPGQVSPSDISQALHFFQKLSSDMKILEARTQHGHTTEQNVPPKPPNIHTLQQYYLQQIEFVRMLKRQHAMGGEVASKVAKFSPTKEENNAITNKDETAIKNVQRTISQIQEQAEIQRRLVAAQNCKNLPALMQYYNVNSPLFRPNVSPPGGQSPSKKTQLSPNSQKSPPSLTPEEQQQLLASQQQMFNAGLTTEMSFHQMFQQYLSQQLKMNQRKQPSGGKRLASPPRKADSPPEKKSPPALPANIDAPPPAPSTPAPVPSPKPVNPPENPPPTCNSSPSSVTSSITPAATT